MTEPVCVLLAADVAGRDLPLTQARSATGVCSALQPPASCSNNISLSNRPMRHSTLLLTSAEGEAQLGSISRRSSPQPALCSCCPWHDLPHPALHRSTLTTPMTRITGSSPSAAVIAPSCCLTRVRRWAGWQDVGLAGRLAGAQGGRTRPFRCIAEPPLFSLASRPACSSPCARLAGLGASVPSVLGSAASPLPLCSLHAG